MTRAQLLGQIMKKYEIPIAVSGTHGKTTTTSMISQILLEENLDPTLSIGGILHSIGGNIRVGHSPYFVTEACEYTNSFLSFFPKIGIVLNIEEDHMDFFENISQIRDSFHKFASLLPQDGLLIINKEILQWEKIVAGLLQLLPLDLTKTATTLQQIFLLILWQSLPLICLLMDPLYPLR